MKPLTKSSLKNIIRRELVKNGIKKASLFGSLLRGDFKETSDIDIMIEAKDDMSLMDLARLKRELEEASGFKVDIITYRSLDPRYRTSFISNSEELI